MYMRCINHKAIYAIAPFEMTLLFNPVYHVPPCSPLSEVVVNLRIGDCFPSEVKDIIHNLDHMPLSEAVATTHPLLTSSINQFMTNSERLASQIIDGLWAYHAGSKTVF
jgi:hypothetical protein